MPTPINALPLALRIWSDDSSAKITVLSFYPDTPVITGIAVDSPSRVSVGSDGVGGTNDSSGAEPTGAPTGVAMFVWTFTATGLASDSSYAFTATQLAGAESGTVKTLPATTDTENFTFFFVSCDGTAFGADPATQDAGSDMGCYGYIRATCSEKNVVSLIHTDDHGYVDGRRTSDSSFSDGSVRFNTVSPNTDQDIGAGVAYTEYAYAIAYGAYVGLIETVSGVTGSLDTRFLQEDRIWCHHNLPMIIGTGDHDIVNNLEESAFTGQPMTAAWRNVAMNAYCNTIGAGQNYIDAAASPTKKHAAQINYLGPIEVITYDRVFAIDTVGTKIYDIAALTSIRESDDTKRWLGTDQRDDILGAIDATSPFKVLAMSTGSYQMMSDADMAANRLLGWGVATLGAQQPLDRYTLTAAGGSEFQDIMTDIAAGGIAAKESSTYGPQVVGLHGDTHRPYAYYHFYPRTASQSCLSMYEISSGTVNGQPMQGLCDAILDSTEYRGSHVLWIPDFTNRNFALSTSDNRNTCIQVDMSKSTGDWVMTVRVIECADESPIGTEIYSVEIKENETSAPEYLRQGWL